MTTHRLAVLIHRCTATTVCLGFILASVFGISSTGNVFGQDASSAGSLWPQWRGPEGNQHSADDVKLPRRWNLETGEGIRWKTKIPGRGHSTPIVTPYGIYLTTSEVDKQTQSVLRFDVETGRMLNEWVLHEGGLPRQIHPNNSHASASMAFDRENLFACFYTQGAIFMTALSPDGTEQWQTRVCEYNPSLYKFGFGSSPIVEDDLVIIAAEYDGPESGIYALDRTTGRQVWKIDRPANNLNFTTPIVATTAGRRQLLVGGANQFASFDPQTGKRIWKVDTTTAAICGTVAWMIAT